MNVSGKRQKKNRARARTRAMGRTRVVVKQFELEHLGVIDCAIGGVVFYASDSEPCDCWGESVRWVALPFTREQLLHQTSAQLLHLSREGLIQQGVVPPSNI